MWGKVKQNQRFYRPFTAGFSPVRGAGKYLSRKGTSATVNVLSRTVVQRPARWGREGELVGVQGLAGLAVAAVHVAPAVLAVPQQRAADFRHGHPDLVGPAGEEPALHQGQGPPGSPASGRGSRRSCRRGRGGGRTPPAFWPHPLIKSPRSSPPPAWAGPR